MAGVAGNASGMIGGDNLRESFWLGAVCLVAARADDGRIRKLGLRGRGIIGMPALCAVAGFARNVGVPVELLLADDVGVARFAGLVTGEGRGAGGDLSDGVAAVMTVLAEAFGNDRAAQDNEQQQRQQHHGGEADEMFDVLEHFCFSRPKRESCSATL